MHSTEDYAIMFKDGFGLHYVHGVFFNKEDFEKYVKGKKATGQQIIAVKNTEQKAVLIKIYGYEKVLSDLPNLKVLDIYEKVSKITGKNTKCELMEFDLTKTLKHKILKVEDHSTHKITFLGMPRQIKTCLEGLAWSFDVKEGDYAKLVQMES